MADVVETDLIPRGSRYPWHEWTDGRTWRLKRGADFQRPVERMKTSVYQHARNHGMRATTHSVDSDTLDIQFRPAD